MTLHISSFPGGNALPGFRAQRLLAGLQEVNPDITHISGQFVHLVAVQQASGAAPDAALHTRLSALLAYGDPADAAPADAAVCVVAPRLGTVSPWASKASVRPQLRAMSLALDAQGDTVPRRGATTQTAASLGSA